MSKLNIPLCVLAAMALGVGCHRTAGPTPRAAALKLKIGGADLSLQTPLTPADEARGLMGVAEIPENAGMLFDERDKREHPVPSMWMKNCPIPMDMVFCAPDGRIQKILTARAEPATKADESYPEYTPLGELAYPALVEAVRNHAMPTCDWVFELRAGRAVQLGLAEGQVLAQLTDLAWAPVRPVPPDHGTAMGLRLVSTPQGDELRQAPVVP